MIHSILVISSLLLLSQSHALVPIPNGVETKDFPEVVALLFQSAKQGAFGCTGTVVGPNSVLTAAHCLSHFENEDVIVTIHSEKYSSPILVTEGFINPEFTKINTASKLLENQIVSDHKAGQPLTSEEAKNIKLLLKLKYRLSSMDLGLLKFDEKSSPLPFKKINLSVDQSYLNQTVTQVGYGRNDLTAWFHTGSGTKRFGTNQISVISDGMLFTTGHIRESFYQLFGLWTKADGKDVGVGPGDSGGPMLDSNGNVIGVNVAVIKNKIQLAGFLSHIGRQSDPILREIGADNEKTLIVTTNLSHDLNLYFLIFAKKFGFQFKAKVSK